jgi:hypothetical protein
VLYSKPLSTRSSRCCSSPPTTPSRTFWFGMSQGAWSSGVLPEQDSSDAQPLRFPQFGQGPQGRLLAFRERRRLEHRRARRRCRRTDEFRHVPRRFQLRAARRMRAPSIMSGSASAKKSASSSTAKPSSNSRSKCRCATAQCSFGEAPARKAEEGSPKKAPRKRPHPPRRRPRKEAAREEEKIIRSQAFALRSTGTASACPGFFCQDRSAENADDGTRHGLRGRRQRIALDSTRKPVYFTNL